VFCEAVFFGYQLIVVLTLIKKTRQQKREADASLFICVLFALSAKAKTKSL
jgi:hypothetical protein